MIVILDGMKQTRYDGLIRSPSAALRFNFVIARTRKGGSRAALTIETIVLLTFYEIIKYKGPWKRPGGVAFLRSPQAFAVAPLPNFPAGGSSSRTVDLGNFPRAIRIAKNLQIR